MVIAIMVGDDREHTVDVADLTPIAEDDYCPNAGRSAARLTRSSLEHGPIPAGGAMLRTGPVPR